MGSGRRVNAGGNSTPSRNFASSHEQVKWILAKSSALAREGRDDENEALLREALNRHPDHAELYLRTASAVCLTAPEESKDYLRRAASLAPDDPGVLLRCASLFCELDEIEESLHWLRRVHALVDENFPRGIEMVHLLGKPAEHKGHYDNAERAYLCAFEEEPATIGHGRVLAEYYMRCGRMVEALDIVSKALAALPDEEPLHHLRAQILAELKTTKNESP